MNRAVLLALAVVSVGLLAGCSFAAGDGADPTVTAAPVPTVDDRTPPGGAGTAATVTTAAGEGRSWMVGREFRSARDLASDHRAVLADTAYRVREHYEFTTSGVEVRDSRTVQDSTTWYRGGTVRHERQRYRAPLSNASAGHWENVSVFERDGRRYVRTRENGTTDYRVVEHPTTSVGRLYPNSTRAVTQLLAVEDATVEVLFWNGQHYYRIHGSGSRNPGFGLAQNYTVDALIETTGLVRRLRVSYTESPIGRERTTVYEMTVTPITHSGGETPDWVADVPANATAW